jgi:uncharacterized membrane protein
MRYKTYRMWQGFIGMALGAIGGASVALQLWLVFVIAIVLGTLLIIYLRRKVVDIVADERTHAIAGKAARLALQLLAFIMVVTGAILLALSNSENETLTWVGFALEYATCGLLVLNYLAYIYYSRKFGGN